MFPKKTNDLQSLEDVKIQIKAKMMEKIESKFWFSNPYKDDQGREQKATVVLEINYRNKQYSIISNDGIKGEFKFQKTSHKHNMWKATIAGIDQAIDFANQELRIEKE
jgi:hypothetical protein